MFRSGHRDREWRLPLLASRQMGRNQGCRGAEQERGRRAMTPSREEALFALALEKPAEKRPAFLDAVCEGDTALRARLEALLAAHEQPETLLATQAETARPYHQARPR